MSRVSNDIEREIAAAMRDCIGENEAVLEQRAAAAGKEAVKRLKAESRKRSGKYAKGWTSTVDHASLEQGVEVTVHNKQYQLTHLLEKGHKVKNQTGKTYGVAPGNGVIAAVAEEVGREFAAGGDAT